MNNAPSSLPYQDTKPVGAADFYFANNATFRFILRRLGRQGLLRYWNDLGRRYYAPVATLWREGGLPAVAGYWRDFFKAEPGAEVSVTEHDTEVRVEVKTCPAIKHLRDNRREIVPCFCQHCYFVSEAIAASAGFTARVRGGNGSCTQRFLKLDAATEPQQMEEIKEAL